jgi:molybdopterin-guanine dinucleotide biosynthesis protein B
MIASPYRVAIMRELRGESEPSLAAQLERMAAADLTLVEGYKWEPIPKLEVHRPALGQPALHESDANIIAVASDVAPPAALRDGVAWLDLNQPAQVLEWISRTIIRRAA